MLLLGDMGFYDFEKNLAALIRHNLLIDDALMDIM
jgi:hypothetical protein